MTEQLLWKSSRASILSLGVGVAIERILVRVRALHSRHRIAPDLVAGILGPTPTESRVAVWLADGRSVREMADATGRTEGSINWHLKQIYRKQPISRQAGLVRLVLSITEFG